MYRKFSVAIGVTLLGILGAFVVSIGTVSAHELDSPRSYEYAAIETQFEVKRDTTVFVQEKQTYDFRGHYHKGYRNIPHKGIDAISDVVVKDGKTGLSLEYSKSTLDKNDPSSWGKYTSYTSNGETIIEWYYNATDEQRTWTLEYVIHGSIGFLSGFDEFYWNLFTDYDVPVQLATARVVIPEALSNPQLFRLASYSGDTTGSGEVVDTRTVFFSQTNLAPHEDYTIAVGWPEGIIDRAAYWREYLRGLLPFAIAGLISFGSLVYAFGYVYYHERWNVGRGTIIPMYEPPRKLKPAMAEVIVKEGSSSRSWPATLIDLAVRGYLVIKEDVTSFETQHTFLAKMMPKQYIVSLVPGKSRDDLSIFERELIGVLFANGAQDFSTRALSKESISKRQRFAVEMQKLPKILYKETEEETGAYAITLTKRQESWPLVILIILMIIGGFFGVPLALVIGPWILILGSASFAVVVVTYVRKYEPRLNHEGNILKEEIQGFKLYLKTAEKYRLQNLTPETFEKFLPYAMVFGVEKKWAKSFEGITMVPPTWYQGSVSSTGSFSSSGVSGFSASSFASGFSTSFASSFATSSGTGGSGGGGSSGGGGGGGGGGAS